MKGPTLPQVGGEDIAPNPFANRHLKPGVQLHTPASLVPTSHGPEAALRNTSAIALNPVF
jgi:hypothetical protein